MSPDHLGIDAKSASTRQISQSQPVGWYGGLLCNRSGRGATVVYIGSRNSNRSLVNCVISDAQFFGDPSRFLDTGRRSTCFVMGLCGGGDAVGPCAMDRSICWTWRFLQTLAIPLILAHFRRSDKATWVVGAFLISCTLLLLLSYLLALWPGLTWRGARHPGVPVKEYVAQSTEFVICFFVLLAIGFRFVHRHLLVSTGVFVVAVLFLVNVFYIASGRTALVVIAVLLFVFAFWQWEWKKAVVVLLTAVVCAFVVWKTSTYLRTELALMPGEIQRYLVKMRVLDQVNGLSTGKSLFPSFPMRRFWDTARDQSGSCFVRLLLDSQGHRLLSLTTPTTKR